MPDVPLIPKTGWKAFPSQDLPSLFNYGHVYHYALESLPALAGEQNDRECVSGYQINGKILTGTSINPGLTAFNSLRRLWKWYEYFHT